MQLSSRSGMLCDSLRGQDLSIAQGIAEGGRWATPPGANIRIGNRARRGGRLLHVSSPRRAVHVVRQSRPAPESSHPEPIEFVVRSCTDRAARDSRMLRAHSSRNSTKSVKHAIDRCVLPQSSCRVGGSERGRRERLHRSQDWPWLAAVMPVQSDRRPHTNLDDKCKPCRWPI